MTAVVHLLVFGSALILQMTFLRMFGSFAPDVMLLASVFYGLRYLKIAGYQAGIIAGLIQDSLSHGIIGLNLLAKGLTGFTAGWLKEINVIDSNSPATWGALILFGTLLNEFLLRSFFAGFHGVPFEFSAFLIGVGSQSVLNLVFGLPFLIAVESFFKWFKSAFGVRDY